MYASRIARSIIVGALLAFLALQAYQFGGGVARHGSISAYLEAKERTGKFSNAVQLINDYYVDGPPVELNGLTDKALESIVSELDPYSEYLTPEKLSALREDAEQQFGGIGIRVEMKYGRLTIVAPLEGTPSSRAGLQRGDQITAVNGSSIVGRPLSDSIGELKGSPGTPVRLTVYRPRNDETFEASLVRERITVENVQAAKLLESGIGYLRISQFGALTGNEMIAAIDSLLAQGMESLIIDLRDNPGGLLDAAVEVAAPFLDPGQLIVYTEGRQRHQSSRFRVEEQKAKYDFPLVLLVNSYSASASEIVAGALKDWKRARLVGDKTFGKGSVQSVIGLGADSGLRLTTARYYTPGGYVIHEKGIEPDVAVELTADEEQKLTVQRYRLEFMPVEEFVREFEFEPIEDRQLRAAVDLLSGSS